MNSRDGKRPTPDEKKPRPNPSTEQSPGDEQTQATGEDFEEEGMGVAPKE